LYEISITGPTDACIAMVTQDGRAIDRKALAGWYSPEFAAVGEDRAALESLAQSSGGKVIEPGQTSPIDFHWPRRPYPLASWLAVCGAIFLAAGLLAWKRG
jgi:hypothetical protein